MNIIEYLCREASKITQKSLSDLKDPEYWRRTKTRRREQFIEMLGLSDYLSREEYFRPTLEVTGVIECDDYVIKKVHFQSLPSLYVTGSLYVPEGVKGQKPAVLYLCGHAMNQKFHYQFHGHKFAKLGFVTLMIETIQKGEIRGHHHGTYHYGWFYWYSLGYTPAGVEVWNAIKALDILQSMPEVDPDHIGVTGISGGGAMSWFTAAVDERIKAVAPVCGTATIKSHVCKRTIEGHCDCMFWINNYMWDLTDVGALIAPRPLLIASAIRDWIFDIESVRLIYRKLKRLYEMLGVPDNIVLVETPGGHSYHEMSRCMIYKWFLKHLKGVDKSLEELREFDREPIPEKSLDELKVFKEVPLDEKVTTVQEWFIEPVKPPKISSIHELKEHKTSLSILLYEKTFNVFPEKPCDLNVEVELVQESESWLGYWIGFTPEESWRLHMHIFKPIEAKGSVPVLMFLARTARNLYFGDELLRGLSREWARAIVEVRGIGETSWSPDLQWFIRRAAMLTGRTITSMRIYDALRALEVVNSLDWVQRDKIAIMGSGEMAVVALYTALLREDLKAVILHDPPPTHRIPSNPDGTGAIIELLNVLRYTDLPYVAGLLWPTELVFLGPRPNTYSWAEELYVKLGPPGVVRHIKDLAQWNFK